MHYQKNESLVKRFRKTQKFSSHPEAPSSDSDTELGEKNRAVAMS